MKTAFKLELVVAKGHSGKIIDYLEQADIHEYTIIDIDKGQGNKDGAVRRTGLGATDNVYIIVICDAAHKDKAVELINPFFKITGGMFYLSEVTLIDP